ncbi:hypothetical protein GCM10010424_06990 [Streptomyces lienomycini]
MRIPLLLVPGGNGDLRNQTAGFDGPDLPSRFEQRPTQGNATCDAKMLVNGVPCEVEGRADGAAVRTGGGPHTPWDRSHAACPEDWLVPVPGVKT